MVGRGRGCGGKGWKLRAAAVQAAGAAWGAGGGGRGAAGHGRCVQAALACLSRCSTMSLSMRCWVETELHISRMRPGSGLAVLLQNGLLMTMTCSSLINGWEVKHCVYGRLCPGLYFCLLGCESYDRSLLVGEHIAQHEYSLHPSVLQRVARKSCCSMRSVSAQSLWLRSLLPATPRQTCDGSPTTSSSQPLNPRTTCASHAILIQQQHHQSSPSAGCCWTCGSCARACCGWHSPCSSRWMWRA